jgi:hypothetical protein
MRNGGLPPAHLPSSSLSDPLAWLQYKWSQPPPRAPDWVFNDYQKFDPPANVGRPLCDKEWHQQAFHEDAQAAGILPPDPPEGPILHGACARAEHAYRDWKWAVDNLWEDKRHRLQMAACQRQEANRCQQLLDKHAAYENQEAVHRQRLLDEETARLQRLLYEDAACCLMAKRAALARQMAAAQTIFLWLCRRRLHVRLARQTSRGQQHKAPLARLRYEQDCCLHAALVGEQQQQAAAAGAMALADKADEQFCHEAAARTAEAAALAEAALARMQYKLDCCSCAALTEEQQRQAAAAQAKASAELVAHAAASAETLLANKRCRLEAAERATALAAKALADERQHRDATECAAALAAKTLADKKEVAERARESAAAALAAQVFTESKRRQEEDERVLALDVPPNPVDTAIRRIQAE